jgi:hypothetical protein
LKMGNRQHVMIDGGKSFGTWTMTEILARTGLLPGVDGSMREKLREDKVSFAHLQHSALVWDIMYRYASYSIIPCCVISLPRPGMGDLRNIIYDGSLFKNDV